MENKKMLSVYVDVEIVEWIEEIAEKEDRPKSRVASRIIEAAYKSKK